MPDLLMKELVAVGCDNELVLMQMGNLRFSMEFIVALQLAVALKTQARIAKVASGRTDYQISSVGVLHDANRSRPAVSRRAKRLPALLAARGIGISTEGQLVVMVLGNTTAKLPFDVAAKLAQWLRVRGREAQGNAGEMRHWSKLLQADGRSINGSGG